MSNKLWETRLITTITLYDIGDFWGEQILLDGLYVAWSTQLYNNFFNWDVRKYKKGEANDDKIKIRNTKELDIQTRIEISVRHQ